MLYTDLTKKAMKIAFEAHKDQLDKNGIPYIYHPVHPAFREYAVFFHDELKIKDKDGNTVTEERIIDLVRVYNIFIDKVID